MAEPTASAGTKIIVHHLNNSRSQRILWLLVCPCHVTFTLSYQLNEFVCRKSLNCHTKLRNTNVWLTSSPRRSSKQYIRWG